MRNCLNCCYLAFEFLLFASCNLLEEAKNKEANGVLTTSIKHLENHNYHQNQGGAKNIFVTWRVVEKASSSFLTISTTNPRRIMPSIAPFSLNQRHKSMQYALGSLSSNYLYKNTLLHKVAACCCWQSRCQ